MFGKTEVGNVDVTVVARPKDKHIFIERERTRAGKGGQSVWENSKVQAIIIYNILGTIYSRVISADISTFIFIARFN